jgi:hypothetical protein
MPVKNELDNYFCSLNAVYDMHAHVLVLGILYSVNSKGDRDVCL